MSGAASSFRLVPAETRIAALEKGYRNMATMAFGEAPTFDSIMTRRKIIRR